MAARSDDSVDELRTSIRTLSIDDEIRNARVTNIKRDQIRTKSLDICERRYVSPVASGKQESYCLLPPSTELARLAATGEDPLAHMAPSSESLHSSTPTSQVMLVHFGGEGTSKDSVVGDAEIAAVPSEEHIPARRMRIPSETTLMRRIASGQQFDASDESINGKMEPGLAISDLSISSIDDVSGRGHSGRTSSSSDISIAELPPTPTPPERIGARPQLRQVAVTKLIEENAPNTGNKSFDSTCVKPECARSLGITMHEDVPCMAVSQSAAIHDYALRGVAALCALSLRPEFVEYVVSATMRTSATESVSLSGRIDIVCRDDLGLLRVVDIKTSSLARKSTWYVDGLRRKYIQQVQLYTMMLSLQHGSSSVGNPIILCLPNDGAVCVIKRAEIAYNPRRWLASGNVPLDALAAYGGDKPTVSTLNLWFDD